METAVYTLAIILIVYLLRYSIIALFFVIIIAIGIVIRYTLEAISKIFEAINLWFDS